MDRCPTCRRRSWKGKPLVSDEVHAARRAAHAAVDPLWQHAEDHYEIAEPPATPGRAGAVKRVRNAARGRTYQYLAALTGLSMQEMHISRITDVEILRRIEAAAQATTTAAIRAWAKARDEEV